MTNPLKIARAFIALAFVGASFASGATAQRTFVASNGIDANPCGIAAPCRSLAAAIAQTSAGGEVIVLDSGGYGPVTITRSVSIIAPPGVYAGVSVSSGVGIAINAAAIHVRLQGLFINGQGGTTGIRYQQGASLHVEGCKVHGFSGDGISIEGPGYVTLVDTASSQNAGNGIAVDAAATVTIARARAELNGFDGIRIGGGANASITAATVAKNTNGGIVGRQEVEGTTRVAIDSSVVSDNFFGVWALASANGPTATVGLDVASSTIARNSIGVYAQSTVGANTTSISATGNQILGSQQYAIAGGFPNARVRATQNTIMHNSTGFNGGFTTGNNYVRENGIDSSGHTPDSLM